MASVKVFVVLSALVLTICLIEMSAGSPFASPSVGKHNKGKNKKLGNIFFCSLILYYILHKRKCILFSCFTLKILFSLSSLTVFMTCSLFRYVRWL